jgi:hypothetical protein
MFNEIQKDYMNLWQTEVVGNMGGGGSSSFSHLGKDCR